MCVYTHTYIYRDGYIHIIVCTYIYICVYIYIYIRVRGCPNGVRNPLEGGCVVRKSCCCCSSCCSRSPGATHPRPTRDSPGGALAERLSQRSCCGGLSQSSLAHGLLRTGSREHALTDGLSQTGSRSCALHLQCHPRPTRRGSRKVLAEGSRRIFSHTGSRARALASGLSRTSSRRRRFPRLASPTPSLLSANAGLLVVSSAVAILAQEFGIPECLQESWAYLGDLAVIRRQRLPDTPRELCFSWRSCCHSTAETSRYSSHASCEKKEDSHHFAIH